MKALIYLSAFRRKNNSSTANHRETTKTWIVDWLAVNLPRLAIHTIYLRPWKSTSDDVSFKT